MRLGGGSRHCRHDTPRFGSAKFLRLKIQCDAR